MRVGTGPAPASSPRRSPGLTAADRWPRGLDPVGSYRDGSRTRCTMSQSSSDPEDVFEHLEGPRPGTGEQPSPNRSSARSRPARTMKPRGSSPRKSRSSGGTIGTARRSSSTPSSGAEPAVVSTLLEANCPADTINESGRTPLMEAAWHGRLEFARMLIGAGPIPTSWSRTIAGAETPRLSASVPCILP